MHITEGDDASKLRLSFCRELLRDLDAVKAAVRAGVNENDAPAFAARLTRQASTWQLVELMSLAARYQHDPRYQNPPSPITDNVYYCCSQKTGSQWLKQILIDPAFYQATGLKVAPKVRAVRSGGAATHGADSPLRELRHLCGNPQAGALQDLLHCSRSAGCGSLVVLLGAFLAQSDLIRFPGCASG